MGRWRKYYVEDRRVWTSPPSLCARRAADVFKAQGKRVILDLGCGAGRDAVCLAEAGLTVVGTDIEDAGLAILQRRIAERPADVLPVRADARRLPFSDAVFEGIYSFGLLHDFTSMERDAEVRQAMAEMHRTLQPGGLLVLAVLAGDFRFTLPDVYVFSEHMFRRATEDFTPVEIKQYDDIGCTGKTDYPIWYGVFLR
jgi:SAM-dependent methyltransferase